MAVLHVSSGHHSLQGPRPTQEDEYYVCQNFELPDTELQGPMSFYAIFDGHGGREASVYCRRNLFKNLLVELRRARDPEEALRNAFLRTDESFLASSGPQITAGTTANVALLQHATRSLWVANAGDSRCVLSSGDDAVPLSRDHKADRPDEVERIRKAGGFVIHNRVMGGLAVSRALGNSEFKTKNMTLVLAEPEIECRILTEADAFLVLACDGLFDVMSNDEAAYFVRRLIKRKKPCDTVCKAIAEHASQNLQSRDNVSVILVNFWEALTETIYMDDIDFAPPRPQAETAEDNAPDDGTPPPGGSKDQEAGAGDSVPAPEQSEAPLDALSSIAADLRLESSDVCHDGAGAPSQN